MSNEHKVSTCLWFDDQAEEAARFYVSLIPGSRVTSITRYGAEGPMPEGTALVVNFDLGGSSYMALNGGPEFRHSAAASIVVRCGSQAEIDGLWSKLIANGGAESHCFWLNDRFGLFWQIVPEKIEEWMTSRDKVAAARVMSVVIKSVKADIAKLEAAYHGH